jgi:hypothetical protein
MGARWLLAIVAALALALLVWGLWPDSKPPDARSPLAAQHPTAAAHPATQPPVEATPTDRRSTPPPAEGEAFVAAGTGGLRVHGRLWRATAAAAPLVLLVPDDGAHARQWQPLVTLMRQVGDYNIAAWDGLALTDREHGGVGRLREMVAVETVQRHVRAMVGGPAGPLGLVGLGSGAAAALLMSGDRTDVLATVAISPTASLGPQTLASAMDQLRRRHVMVIASADDDGSRVAVERLRDLPHARVVSRAGSARGLALLAVMPGLRAEINGWLFALLGPKRPATSTDSP